MPKNSYILEFKSKGTKKAKDDIDKLDQSQKKLGISAGTLKKGLGIAGIAIAALGTKAISTAAQFETLRTRLNTMYGSISRGTKAFQTFNKVAATTPFAVKDVVTAGASLKAFGMDAEDTIKQVADLAAFMGTDIVDAANAMGRAFAGGAGAADVLRDKGILQLIKDMKGLDDLTKLTLPEFRTALTDALSDPAIGIAGSTDALAQTFEGNFSNMMDAVDRLAAKMGESLLPTAITVVNKLAEFAGVAASTVNPLQEEINMIRKQQMEMNLLVRSLEGANEGSELWHTLIKRIKTEYPSLLDNIEDEKDFIGQVKDNLKESNKHRADEIRILMQKMKVKALEEEITEVYRKQFSLIGEVAESQTNMMINVRANVQNVIKVLQKHL